MASNKSKDNVALELHVMAYSSVLGVLAGFIFGVGPDWGAFVLVNAALHFATDYCTSRWTSRLFGAWLKDMQDTRHIHNFFVVIGLDQLVHQVTLATTMWYFLT